MCIIGQLCTATPCQNGGTCLESGNSRTCDCIAGYTGEDCETGGELFLGKPLKMYALIPSIAPGPGVVYSFGLSVLSS